MSYDPHYSSVALLLHCDGADGSTTFTDNGPGAKTVSVTGGASVKTSSAKFGTGGGLLDGTGDYLSVPASSDFAFGTGDFGVEFWIKTSDSGESVIVDQFSSGSAFSSWQLSVKSGVLSWYRRLVGGSSGYLLTGTATISDNAWHHIAVTRASSTLRFFVDGVANGSVTDTADYATSVVTLGIGAQVYSRNSAYDLAASLDDFRITKGVARYTATFTPPIDAYPDNGPDGNYVIASAPTPLGAPAALAEYGQLFYCRSSAPTPLGAALVLSKVPTTAKASAPTPLGSASAYALTPFHALASAPTPLCAASVVGYIPTAARAKAPSPLGAWLAVALHDFTCAISPYAATRYVMDLITPSGTVRVPISSWQATLRTGASSYVQCVIPAAQPWGATINAATSFRILRRAVTTGGQVIEYLMAEAPADTPQFDRGPTNPTCTLSGYAPGFADQDVSPGTDRTLTGIRSISSGASYRVRCAVDWLLRPGQRGVVDGVPFVVEWINYYVNTNDAYMEAGA